MCLMPLIVDNVCKCTLVYRSMTSWAMRLIGGREFVNPRHDDGCHPWLRECLVLRLNKYTGKLSSHIHTRILKELSLRSHSSSSGELGNLMSKSNIIKLRNFDLLGKRRRFEKFNFLKYLKVFTYAKI